LPVAGSAVDIESPMAAVCPDGAVWICWVQTPRSGHQADVNTADLGVFCKMMTRDGRPAFGPRRLVTGSQYRDALDPQPWPFFLTSTPIGGAALFLRTGQAGPDGVTQVVLLDRAGAVRSTKINFVPAGSRGWLPQPPVEVLSGAGTFQVCFAPDGVMHCFFWSGRVLATAAVLTGRQPTVAYTKLFYPFGRPGSPPALDTATLRLAKLAGRRDLTAVYFTNTDTVAVVVADRTASVGDPDRRDDSLMVYRFALPDVKAVGEVRLPRHAVKGVDWTDVPIPGALAAPTGNGAVFLTSGLGGTGQYALDSSAQPQLGARSRAPVASAPPGILRTEAIFFTQSGTGRPWHIEWYGVDDHGVLYSDTHVCESIPGRTR
jgi:hypothetical protein